MARGEPGNVAGRFAFLPVDALEQVEPRRLDRRDRARSIAAWFRKRGVKIPISYEGFGETSLAVKTADSVDEIRNRRVDYVLSDGPPVYSAAFKPSWKRIP